jgi:hypothetical protein
MSRQLAERPQLPAEVSADVPFRLGNNLGRLVFQRGNCMLDALVEECRLAIALFETSKPLKEFLHLARQ